MNPDYFRALARYNQWANARVHDACAALPAAAYFRPRPAYFKSLHGTLNHILVADRLWLSRIEPPQGYMPLNTILFEDLASLRAAREAEDARIVGLVDAMDAATIAGPLRYTNNSCKPFETPMAFVLGHLFNHQTHHRGQVHDRLTQVMPEPPELDLIFFLRSAGLG